MPRKKIKKPSDKKVAEAVDNWNGNITKAAEELGVSRSYISRRQDRIAGKNMLAVVQPETSDRVFDKLDTFAQIQNINDVANSLMDNAKEQDPEFCLRAAGEIRNQLKLNVEIMEKIFNMKHVKIYQETVLEVMGETSPKLRAEFVKRLQERKAASGFF